MPGNNYIMDDQFFKLAYKTAKSIPCSFSTQQELDPMSAKVSNDKISDSIESNYKKAEDYEDVSDFESSEDESEKLELQNSTSDIYMRLYDETDKDYCFVVQINGTYGCENLIKRISSHDITGFTIEFNAQRFKTQWLKDQFNFFHDPVLHCLVSQSFMF